MIIYSKTLWGLPLLSRIYGSALPRSLAPALFSGFLTGILLLLGNRVEQLWSHPYAYQPFVLIVTFVLAFRSNYAYQRHWEAYTHMQTMSARLLDAAIQIIMFDKHPQLPEGRKQEEQQPSARAALAAAAAHQQFVCEVVHTISLLHALSCAALRRDPDLANLSRHSGLQEAPPSDPAMLQRSSLSTATGPAAPGTPAAAAAAAGPESSAGSLSPDSPRSPRSPRVSSLTKWAAPFDREVNIVGAANWRDIFMLRGSSNTIRKYNMAQPLPVVGGLSPQEMAALGCRLRAGKGTDGSDADVGDGCRQEVGWGWSSKLPGKWPTAVGQAGSKAQHDANSSSTSLWGMLRQRQQVAEHHQQHSGVWPRSHSYSEGATRQSRLAASSAPPGDTTSGTANLKQRRPSSGSTSSSNKRLLLTQRNLSTRFRVSCNYSCCPGHLPFMDRPLLVLAWLHELLLQRQSAGGLQLPAPILARVHTCLSDSIQGFQQCRKLADTPFPFPWAQFVLVMLVLFTLTLPLLVLAYVPYSGLAITLTVATVATYWTVNEVARDVEDPFIYEPNDMPLANQQYHFNELLLALASAERPANGVMPVLLPMAAAAAGLAAPAGHVLGLGLPRVGSAMPAAAGWLPNKQQTPTAAEAEATAASAAAAAAAAGCGAEQERQWAQRPNSTAAGAMAVELAATAASAPFGVDDDDDDDDAALASTLQPDDGPVHHLQHHHHQQQQRRQQQQVDQLQLPPVTSCSKRCTSGGGSGPATSDAQPGSRAGVAAVGGGDDCCSGRDAGSSQAATPSVVRPSCSGVVSWQQASSSNHTGSSQCVDDMV